MLASFEAGMNSPKLAVTRKHYVIERQKPIRGNYWLFNGIKAPSMKVRTKVLASFEAGMNSPNLPWHVNITSLKHRSRFGEVPCFRQVE